MSFLTKMLAQTSSLSLTSADGWAGWPGVVTQAGVPVSADSALKLSAAWACVRLLSETIAALPLKVYRRLTDGGREEATNHPLFDLLHDRPNENQTSIEARQMMTLHALQRGNGLARIVPGARGFVDQLKPIHPDYVVIEELRGGGLRYQVDEPGEPHATLLDEDVLHLKGLSLDGKRGVSVITYARESIGLALAAGDYGSRYFKNGARASGVIQHPKNLSGPAQERLRAQMAENHTGANQWKPFVFEEGMTWTDVSFNNKDSQFLELLDHQAADVCRWYGVPPHMVGLTDKVTSWGSGIEQLGIAFVTYTLLPWLKRWEQAITRDLILAPRVYFVEHDVAGLLRGDQKARYEAYQIGIQNGWLSANDVRRLENLNPIPDGDIYRAVGAVNPNDPTAKAFSESVQAFWGMQLKAIAKDSVPAAATKAVTPAHDAHYREIVRATAARVARKEALALGRAAKRGGDWPGTVMEFFSDHAAYVADALCVPLDAARAYAAERQAELIDGGPDVLADWEARQADRLAALVLETGDE